MEVIYTTDLSRVGNDCFIFELISIVKVFDMYVVLKVKRITGWFESNGANIIGATDDIWRAKFLYERAGGVLKD